MADLRIFKTAKGSRTDVAIIPDSSTNPGTPAYPSNPEIGFQASDFANYDVINPSTSQLAAGKVKMINLPYTDTAPVPDGTKPIDEIDTPQFGIVREPGDETFAPLTINVYQTIANIDGGETIREAYKSGATIIFRHTTEDLKTGVFCGMHISQAQRGNILNGRLTIASIFAVAAGGSFDLPIEADGTD